LITQFEDAARKLAKQIHYAESNSNEDVPEIQILLKSNAQVTPLRKLNVSRMLRL
jgi:hypothetical protein